MGLLSNEPALRAAYGNDTEPPSEHHSNVIPLSPTAHNLRRVTHPVSRYTATQEAVCR